MRRVLCAAVAAVMSLGGYASYAAFEIVATSGDIFLAWMIAVTSTCCIGAVIYIYLGFEP